MAFHQAPAVERGDKRLVHLCHGRPGQLRPTRGRCGPPALSAGLRASRCRYRPAPELIFFLDVASQQPGSIDFGGDGAAAEQGAAEKGLGKSARFGWIFKLASLIHCPLR